MAGTSPGMTVEGVEETGRGTARRHDIDPHPFSRHGRACPGHPRGAEPNRVPNGPGPVRSPRRHRPAWVPGTSPGMTAEGVEETGRGTARRHDIDPHPLSRHGRACPGHPRGAEPNRVPDRPSPDRAPAAAPAGVGARDKPGHDGGGGGGRPVEGWHGGTTSIHTLSPVMAGLVPATHAAPSRTGSRIAPARSEAPRRHRPAWVPGTSRA